MIKLEQDPMVPANLQLYEPAFLATEPRADSGSPSLRTRPLRPLLVLVPSRGLLDLAVAGLCSVRSCFHSKQGSQQYTDISPEVQT